MHVLWHGPLPSLGALFKERGVGRGGCAPAFGLPGCRGSRRKGACALPVGDNDGPGLQLHGLRPWPRQGACQDPNAKQLAHVTRPSLPRGPLGRRSWAPGEGAPLLRRAPPALPPALPLRGIGRHSELPVACHRGSARLACGVVCIPTLSGSAPWSW